MRRERGNALPFVLGNEDRATHQARRAHRRRTSAVTERDGVAQGPGVGAAHDDAGTEPDHVLELARRADVPHEVLAMVAAGGGQGMSGLEQARVVVAAGNAEVDTEVDMAQIEAVNAIDSGDCVGIGNAHAGFHQGDHRGRLILRHELRRLRRRR